MGGGGMEQAGAGVFVFLRLASWQPQTEQNNTHFMSVWVDGGDR